MGREEDQQLSFGVILLVTFEEHAQQRNIAQYGNFAVDRGFIGFHQAANDDRLAIRGDDHGAGGAQVNDGRINIGGDLDRCG